MSEGDDDIVWIREENPSEKESTSPVTPVTVIDAAPTLMDAFERSDPSKSIPPPEVTISAPIEEKTENPDGNVKNETAHLSTTPTHTIPHPPDTPTSCENSISFDISEYEKRLNKTTLEANALLEELDRKTKQVSENNKEVARQINDAREQFSQEASIENIPRKTIDDHSQLPPPPELPSGGLPKNVESVLIGEGILEEITGTLILPNGLVLVTDERAGILLFNLEGTVISKCNTAEFRKLWSPVYYKEHILILADAQNAENHWVRHVIKLTHDLKYVAKIECPNWLAECTILRERLSVALNDHLYLSVCAETFSALYELTPIGQWTELEYKLSEAYTDMLAFATIGPITQLLVVEARRNHVLLVSVRESRIVDKKRMAICERPGALARDEAGRLFVANRYAANIQLVDTIRWVSEKNIAITDGFIRHFTACWGLLAIPLKNAIRLQRYSFRSIR